MFRNGRPMIVSVFNVPMFHCCTLYKPCERMYTVYIVQNGTNGDNKCTKQKMKRQQKICRRLVYGIWWHCVLTWNRFSKRFSFVLNVIFTLFLSPWLCAIIWTMHFFFIYEPRLKKNGWTVERNRAKPKWDPAWITERMKRKTKFNEK